MVSATEIVALQDRLTREWHAPTEARSDGSASGEAAGSGIAGEWSTLIARLHRANFDLWHIEDEARAPDASDAEIARVKRQIDRTNQMRSDLVEKLDREIQDWLKARGLPNPDAPLNSEPPGMTIDRLSILALKIYHTREEAERRDAPAGHAELNRGRLAVLEEQRADLAGCLDALWQETLGGKRRFKLYRQLKMYNDPTLNPAIYSKQQPREDQERANPAQAKSSSRNRED
jgi:Protein of unknown function (DUF4254)